MEETLNIPRLTADQNRRISEVIDRQQSRLRNFVRERVSDAGEAEDILQDVFYELVEAYRGMRRIEHMGAWLYRVARNRIIDSFRKKGREPVRVPADSADEGAWGLEELLPSPDAGPDAAYARGVLLEELNRALEELPEEQRYVFVEHEIEGRSFKELAEETGVNANTLLSRKRYAVLHLRRRLRAIYEEFVNR